MYKLGGGKFTLFFILITLSIIALATARDMHKRSFVGLGCYGNHDKSKFARLERICEECYMLYRESRLHSMCKRDCFRNDVFTKCVDALLLSDEQKKFEEMANDLHGR